MAEQNSTERISDTRISTLIKRDTAMKCKRFYFTSEEFKDYLPLDLCPLCEYSIVMPEYRFCPVCGQRLIRN